MYGGFRPLLKLQIIFSQNFNLVLNDLILEEKRLKLALSRSNYRANNY